jgi:hypothetical protein
MAGRPTAGPALLVVGLAGLLASTVLGWGHAGSYGVRGLGVSGELDVAVRTGWPYLGHPWIELLAAAGCVAVGVLGTRRRRGGVPRAVGAGAATVVGVVLVAVAVRALLLRPTGEFHGSVLATLATTDRLGVVEFSQPTAHPWPGLGALVGLGGLVLVLVGILRTAGAGVVPRPGRSWAAGGLRRRAVAIDTGPLLAGLGAVVLVVSAFFAVHAPDEDRSCAGSSGRHGAFDADEARAICALAVRGASFGPEDRRWGALGHPWVELVALALIAVLVVVALVAAGARERGTGGPVTPIGAAALIAAAALAAAVLRVLVVRPDVRFPPPTDGAPGGTVALSVAVGGWLLLGGLVIVCAGLVMTLLDDRRRASGRAIPAVPPTDPAFHGPGR